MALHWSVEDVVDYKTTCFFTAEAEDAGRGVEVGDRVMHPITRALTFATMPIGINRITKANAGTFYTRLSAWEKLMGASCWVDGKDHYITREEVKKHIGLSTNATNKTSREFWLDLGQIWERQHNDR